MKTQTIATFHVIGLSVRTTNQNAQAAQDIPALWQQFMAADIANKIPNKIGNALYCVYTAYEKDHTAPYTCILGYKVANLDIVPHGMVSTTIAEATYSIHTVKGDINNALVYKGWLDIWNADLDRSFSADFELYDHRAQDAEHAEVDICIALK